MSMHAHEQLRPHLQAGETLLWCGRSTKGWSSVGGVVALSLVALFVLSIWFFLIREDHIKDANRRFAVILVSLAAAHSWVKAVLGRRRLKRAAYGVTNLRVIIANSPLLGDARSISWRTLKDVSLTGTERCGSIHCSRESMDWKDQSKPGHDAHPALFSMILDPGAVHDLILEQRERSLALSLPQPVLRRPSDGAQASRVPGMPSGHHER